MGAYLQAFLSFLMYKEVKKWVFGIAHTMHLFIYIHIKDVDWDLIRHAVVINGWQKGAG
jgi:hypothetical protein